MRNSFFLDPVLFNAAESATILKIFFTWHFIGDLINKKNTQNKTCFIKSVLLIVL